MPSRSRSGATILLVALPLLKLLIHLSVGSGYGYHADEMYYLACADHPDWSYVDHPAVSIVVLAAARAIFGNGVAAIRIVPAVAGASTVFLVGVMARRLGGSVFAMALSMTAAIVAPFYLSLDAYYSMNSIDLLVWAAAAWLMIRILQSSNTINTEHTEHTEDRDRHRDSPNADRLWIALGILFGVGLENKISVFWLGGGLFAGLLLTPERRLLKTRGPWIAIAIAFVCFIPQIVWQLTHHFATVSFMLGAAENMRDTAPAMFLGLQLDGMLSIAAPIWISGLSFFLVLPQGRSVRALGWAWLAIFALLAFTRSSRAYYLAPAYTWLLAGGGVAIEGWLRPRPVYWLRFVYLALLALGGLQAAPVVLPIAPQAAVAAYSQRTGAGRRTQGRPLTGQLPEFLGQMSGWDEIVNSIADVYDRIPPQERGRTMILAGYYGIASAVDILGRGRGLPLASSGHNTYWFWGPHGSWDGPIIVFGFSDTLVRDSFERVERAGETHCTYCGEKPYTIWIARGLRIPPDELWRRVRRG